MIIGFHGRLGSGKDTAGERLAQLVAVPSRRISFAEKLKVSAAAALDVSVEWLESNKNNGNAKIIVVDGYQQVNDTDVTEANVISELTVRQYLQRYGTEAHRDVFWSDFWVDQAFREVDGKIFPDPLLVYVTDVRFDNEVAGIHKRKGIVVEVKGANEPDIYWYGLADEFGWRYRSNDAPVHPSEWPLENCDFTIDNTRHDDQFVSLDAQLYDIAKNLGLPLREES